MMPSAGTSLKWLRVELRMIVWKPSSTRLLFVIASLMSAIFLTVSARPAMLLCLGVDVVGILPVGGAWGQHTAVDLRFRPSMTALRLSRLVTHRLRPLTQGVSTGVGRQSWARAVEQRTQRSDPWLHGAPLGRRSVEEAAGPPTLKPKPKPS